MNDFEQCYDGFIQLHIKQRTSERKGRLERNDFHGEKLFLKNVWWPFKGNFNHLHPEYEVLDSLIFEIKGFGPRMLLIISRSITGPQCVYCRHYVIKSGSHLQKIHLDRSVIVDFPETLRSKCTFCRL